MLCVEKKFQNENEKMKKFLKVFKTFFKTFLYKNIIFVYRYLVYDVFVMAQNGTGYALIKKIIKTTNGENISF